MKILAIRVAVACVVLLVAACASGQKYADISSSIPALKPGYGRIYFTRPAEFTGSGLQPEIRLNGEHIGRSVAGGFFFVDRPTGDYVVSTATEAEYSTSFHLAAGESKYIKTSVSAGLIVGHITPTIEFPEQGASDVRNLSYAGSAYPMR